MMWLLLPISVGAIIVVQSGLNDKIQSDSSLFHAMFYNNVSFISLSILLLVIQSYRKVLDFPFWSQAHLESLSWWYLIPGILGAYIVGGSAFSFSKIGANKTILLLVAAQIIVSFFWDYFIKNKGFDSYRIIGGLFILAGLLISTKSSQ